MRKFIFILLLIISSFSFCSNEISVDKSVEESVTKDYDQDGKYSSYERWFNSSLTKI